jgi:hypothetical protein
MESITERNIKPLVLPPKSPKFIAHVKGVNCTHLSIGGKTPLQFSRDVGALPKVASPPEDLSHLP